MAVIVLRTILQSTYLNVSLPLRATAEFCASPTNISTTLGILEFWTLHGDQNFHQCLLRSQAFASIYRCLAGLFTFLSCWATVNPDLMEGTGSEL